MENEKVYTYVIFSYLLTFQSFSKLIFSKTVIDLELKLSG